MSVEIGHRLRQAREAQGYSLDEMEQFTRIPAHDLASLEAGDFSNFSSSYYVRAYLRTYANTLGLNPREVVDAYRLVRKGGVDGSAAGRSYQGSAQVRGRGSNPSAINPLPMENKQVAAERQRRHLFPEAPGRSGNRPLQRESRPRKGEGLYASGCSGARRIRTISHA